MCGIAGYVVQGDQPPVSRARLEAMVSSLTHRGPDGGGIHLDGTTGIGMRRLAIVDVADGQQPMSSPDGTVHVVYNGECYNHEALRAELESLGARFRTRCDTEVVVHGFRQWGMRGLAERMNGIYAFCVWDERERTAWVCRDRLGVKPLYWVHRNGRLAFSSELRSLAECGLLRSKIDERALWGYLFWQFTPDDRTLISGARKLPPGSFLRWRDGRVDVETYWDFPDAPELRDANHDEKVEELRALLLDVVDGQMMSDVPIGCFLSGGLDSTIVASMMARLSDRPIRTFSIGFPGNPDCDETPYFERIAKDLGSDHLTIPVTDQELLDTVEPFAWSSDEPVADPAMLPTYLLSKEAAKEVKVVLTGEGADEVFAGYPYYRAFLPDADDAAPGAAATGSWAGVAEALSREHGGFVPAPRNDGRSPISRFPYALPPDFVWSLLHRDRRPDAERLAGFQGRIEERAVGGLTSVSPLQKALALDTKIWLANDLMPKLDKMTMAHSLEGRVPFLDHRLVELAFTMPASFKLDGEHGKLVLRDAVRGIIPDWMTFREKHGFNVPLYQWFRGPLEGFARDTLGGSSFRGMGLFDPRTVEALIDAHVRLDVNVARPLWILCTLGLWFERFRRELRFGAEEGAIEVRSRAGEAEPDSVPGVAEHPDTVPGRTDIVIPIYNGVNYVRDLLRTIDAFTDPPHRVILMDDSDDDATHEALRELVAGRDDVELHRNERNLGFVGNANRGMAKARGEFVCLMNSDTLVSPGWLSRMLETLESDPRIGIVNPTSNSVVNLSIPMMPGANLLTHAEALRRGSRHERPDLTTAVGFCVLVRRRHLDWLGAFDPVYGHGYCEESDFCMRFTEAGLRVVLADDAFVYHKGCGSFGTWLERYEINRKIFDERWDEEYLRDYRHFLGDARLQRIRDRLLRDTIPAEDWNDEAVAAVERSAGRLPKATASRLEAVAGERELVGHGLRPERNTGSERVARAATRAPRSPHDPTQRTVRHPTRPFVDRLDRLHPPGDSLRITFLVQEMVVAGGVTSIVQLAREMILAGHDVRIVTCAPDLDPELFNLPAQPLVYANPDELVRLFPPTDVVVATFWKTAWDYLPRLHARYDLTSVYFLQDYEVYFYPTMEWATRRQVEATFAMADHRIVKTDWLRSLVEENHGVPSEIVPLGLDLGIFRDRRGNADVGSPPKVLSIARPGDARRGFDDCVRLYEWLHEARPDVELQFFGTDDDRMPRDLPFPYVNHGRIFDLNQVAATIGQADVLVDTSLFQGFGRPGIEAMACGTPPVLTDEGGVAEYARDGENCLTVRPRDVQGMGLAVTKLLEDIDLRRSLREGGLATAARYCHRREAARHLSLYRRWLGESRNRTIGAARRA